jgi:hypothetical protein
VTYKIVGGKNPGPAAGRGWTREDGAGCAPYRHTLVPRGLKLSRRSRACSSARARVRCRPVDRKSAFIIIQFVVTDKIYFGKPISVSFYTFRHRFVARIELGQ